MKKMTLLVLSVLFVFNVFAYETENLYVVGNACSAGWSPDNALEMTKESDGIFTWEGELFDYTEDNGNRRFKFLTQRAWENSITVGDPASGHVMITSGAEEALRVFNSGNDNGFQVAETGRYSIEVNLNAMTVVVTKTGDAEEPTIDLNQLYMVGDALNGWGHEYFIGMEKVSDGVFIWSGEIKSGEFKFQNKSNSWDENINPEDDLTFSVGSEYNLRYKSEDKKFRTSETGNYAMLVNLNEMKMKIDFSYPDKSQLYLIGNATPAGWDNANPIAMTEISEGVFTWTGNLSPEGGNEFKFLNEVGNWSKTINPVATDNIEFTKGTEYDLIYRPFEQSPADHKFLVATTGTYTIDVDLNTMKITIDEPGVGNANREVESLLNRILVSNRTVNIKADNNELIQTAAVYDVAGTCLNLVSNANGSTVLAENLAAGIYIVKIKIADKEYVQKIMIK